MSPRSLIGALWVVAAFLALYLSGDLRDWLADEHGEDAWVTQRAVDAMRTADLLQLTALGESLDQVRQYVNADRVVLVADSTESDTGSTEVADAEPVEADGEPEAPVAAVDPGTERATTDTGAFTGGAKAHKVAPRAKRVLLIGASSMQHALGFALQKRLEGYKGLKVKRFGKAATGLSRPDVLDWPAKTRALIKQFKPDVIITNFGGNDAQNLALGRYDRAVFGEKKWDDVYSERVKALVKIGLDSRATVIMLGMPVMRSDRFRKRMYRLNGIMRRATVAAGGIYIDTYDLSSKHGKYRSHFKRDGKNIPLRDKDGIHYTTEGGFWVADRVLNRVERHVRLTPDPESGMARAEHHRFESTALGRTVDYLAFIPPQARKANKVPLLLLLHGATGGWSDWSERAHAELKTLAAQYGIVIVTPDGGEQGWYLDSPLVAENKYATHFIRELLPDIAQHLPVNGKRSIAGLSMGGHGAITLALSNPGTFAAASSMSGVLDLPAADREVLAQLLGPLDGARPEWEARSAIHLVKAKPDQAKALPMKISCGKTDKWLPVNKAFVAALGQVGVNIELDVTGGGHNWWYWTNRLPKHVAWHAEQLGVTPATP